MLINDDKKHNKGRKTVTNQEITSDIEAPQKVAFIKHEENFTKLVGLSLWFLFAVKMTKSALKDEVKDRDISLHSSLTPAQLSPPSNTGQSIFVISKFLLFVRKNVSKQRALLNYTFLLIYSMLR